MMKPQDLMVGDLLRVNRDGLCIKKDTIVQVRGIDGDNRFEEKGLVGCANCRPMDKKQYDGGIWVDYLSPILLTPEILEKNGFKKLGFDGWEFDYVTEGGCLIYEALWRCDYPKEYHTHLTIKSYSPDFGSFKSFRIDSVHELQHALRLCGIEKEISLC